jgi:HEAT repeat protein
LGLSVVAAIAATADAAWAQDVRAATSAVSALHDVVDSPDFRVRMSAALFLGRSRPAGAREALERALADAHPAVRGAAASALGAIGDPAAGPALERRFAVEPSASVRTQIQSAIQQLQQLRSASPPPGNAAHRALSPSARIVVRLGTMRNNSGVRGDELRRVLHESARARAYDLHGADVAEDAQLLEQAAARHVPVVTIDGLLNRLTESPADDGIKVRAAVEFALRRDQELRGVLSGAATSFGSGPSISDQGRRRLQEDAVDGAVHSALQGADGLLVAVR